MPYLGNQLEGNYTSFETQTITGDGSTGYTLSNSVANGKELLVYINNVKQEEGSGKSYTASGTTITFSDAVASTDSCYVVYLGRTSQTVSPPDGSLASYTGNASISGDLTVDTNTLFVDSSNNRVGIGLTSPTVPLQLSIGSDNNAIYAQSSDQYCNIGLIDGSGSGKIIMDSGKLLFTTGGDSSTSFSGSTTKVTIDTSGNVDFTGNLAVASGNGISFAATSDTAGMASELLDDYEEGDFTPTMTPSDSGSITLNSSVDRLAYTKIGRLVHIQGLLETTSKSSPVGSIINIASLPFTPVNASEYAGRAGGGMACQNVAGSTNKTVQPWYILESSAIIYLQLDASTVHPGGSPAYSQFYIYITYITS